MSFQADAFQNSAFQTIAGPDSGTLSASITVVTSVAMVANVVVTAALAAGISVVATPAMAGKVPDTGTMAASIRVGTTVAMAGTSAGQIIIIPRDATDGIEHLLDIGAYDPVAGGVVTLRFGTAGFNTLPSDTPPNAHYDNVVDNPGNYNRSMFSDGTTSGSVDISTGIIEMRNDDGGLDRYADHSFDGYPLTIRSIDRLNGLYASAVIVFVGTIEQAEFTWSTMDLRLRDRLAELDKDLQTVLFAGTTVAGGMNEAEGGPNDLKSQPKPLTYGAPLMVAPVNSNSFDLIYDCGASGLAGIAEVRDKGVLLTATGTDYATVAALRSATVAAGKYSTCLALGLIRLGSVPAGQVTVAPLQGANAAARTAAQIVRSMLLKLGKVEGTDFLTSDLTKLDTLNSAVLGYWTGTEQITGLEAINKVLDSVGAAIVTDRTGRYRIYRLNAPSGFPVLTLTESEILGSDGGDGGSPSGSGLQRVVTNDQGSGVPTYKITVQWGHNWSVMSASDLDVVNTTPAFRIFAEQEWRAAVATDPAIQVIHKLATEQTFDTYFTTAADAQAEATRRLALYGVPRSRYQVPVKSYIVEQVDIGDVVALKVNRFKLDAGKIFRVIGMEVNLQTKITTLDLWG